MGEQKDDHISAFYLHEQQQAFLLSHRAQQMPAASGNSQLQHGGYPSAPSSPSPAVKRARALSQPAIPYFDDLSAASSSSSSQSTLHSASLMSPSMRSYSPVQVHPPSHPYFHSTPAAASRSQPLHAPVPVSAGSRRHSTGAHHRQSRANPKSSKNIFQASPPSVASCSSSSASSSSPHSAEDSRSFSSSSSSFGSAFTDAAPSVNRERRRRKRKDSP